MTPDDPIDRLSDDERLWILLDRYVAGEADPDEIEAARRWLAADPKHLATLNALQRIREVARQQPPTRSVDGAWKRLLLQVGRAGQASPAGASVEVVGGSRSGTRRFVVPRHRLLSRSLAVAAAAAVFVAIGIGYRRRDNARPPVGLSPSASRAQPTPRVFAATRGQRAVFRLVDGTQVMLAPDSRLIVPADFGGVAREVTLEGEALFDAVHDDAKPFLVRARDAVVKDLGTRFAVRGYESDGAVRVVVTHGRVQLRSRSAPDGSGALLDVGMLAQIDGAGATTVRTGVDTARYVAWTAGKLVFVGTPFRQIVLELERWYDIDIRLADAALSARRITATIDEQPLSHLLDQLAVSLNVSATRVGRTVTLTARPSPATPRAPAAPGIDPEGGLP